MDSYPTLPLFDEWGKVRVFIRIHFQSQPPRARPMMLRISLVTNNEIIILKIPAFFVLCFKDSGFSRPGI